MVKLIEASSSSDRKPGELCDRAEQFGARIELMGEDDVTAYGWTHNSMDEGPQALVYESAEDCAAAFLKLAGEKIGEDLGMVLVKEAPPVCWCGSLIKLDRLDIAVQAAHHAVRNGNFKNHGVDIGETVALSLIGCVASRLTNRCLICAVNELAIGEEDSDVTQATKAIKSAMQKVVS